MAVGARLLDLIDRLQAEDRVVVVVLEDLQWADRPSLRAVLFALRRLRVDRVLMVISARSGELTDPGWLRFFGGDSRVTRVRLRGLSSHDVADLADALGLGKLSEKGAARLVAHTKGNALYCRALLDEIGIVGLSGESEGLPAPRELSAVVLARVAALSESAQSFLAAASVLGQHALPVTIASVAQLDGSETEVDAALAAGLLGEVPPGVELAFIHPLYRSAIYSDLSPTNRRRLHLRAAEFTAGQPRLAHRVAASAGPDEVLADELESSAEASTELGDLGSAAWAFEQAAFLSTNEAGRERRLLDAAVTHLERGERNGCSRGVGLVSRHERPAGCAHRTLGGLHRILQRRGPPACCVGTPRWDR